MRFLVQILVGKQKSTSQISKNHHQNYVLNDKLWKKLFKCHAIWVELILNKVCSWNYSPMEPSGLCMALWINLQILLENQSCKMDEKVNWKNDGAERNMKGYTDICIRQSCYGFFILCGQFEVGCRNKLVHIEERNKGNLIPSEN